MNLKTLFVITTIITLVFGVLFIVIPTQFYSWYGIDSNMALDYIGRLFGAALIAVGLISWQARNAADSDARRAIVLSFFIADGIGFIIALIGQLNHVVGNLGWLTVIIYLLISLGFGYFQFSKPKVSES
ncbi:hypothetical protein LJE82_01000 [bacterium BMS3Abin03]|jgi:hypothetical protein|nr:hypothetical protein [bacterium BMS3Abin03]